MEGIENCEFVLIMT